MEGLDLNITAPQFRLPKLGPKVLWFSVSG